MKSTFLVLFLLLATGAFAQTVLSGSSLARNFQPTEHQDRATSQDLGVEQNLLGSNTVFIGHGEMPLSEVPLMFHEVPLGDSARALKQEHVKVKKAHIVWTN
jgi:hypothetical protein